MIRFAKTLLDRQQSRRSKRHLTTSPAALNLHALGCAHRRTRIPSVSNEPELAQRSAAAVATMKDDVTTCRSDTSTSRIYICICVQRLTARFARSLSTGALNVFFIIKVIKCLRVQLYYGIKSRNYIMRCIPGFFYSR